MLPQPVSDDGEDQQDSYHDLLEIRFNVGKIHTILNKADEDRTKNYIAEASSSASETYAADDAGSDGIEWQRSADIGFASSEPCR